MVSIYNQPALVKSTENPLLVTIFIHGVIADMQARGYEHGPPEHITGETLRIDEVTALRLRCPDCERRCKRFIPFRRQGAYVGIALCVVCSGRREV